MAPLPNRRREAFALELAKGKSASEAMRSAGYADPRNSTRLTKNDEIADRVAELRGGASEKAELTLERLLDEAEAARVLAMANGQLGAAIAAIKEKGVLSGLRVEKQERKEVPDLRRLTDAELEAIIATGQQSAPPGGLPTDLRSDHGSPHPQDPPRRRDQS